MLLACAAGPVLDRIPGGQTGGHVLRTWLGAATAVFFVAGPMAPACAQSVPAAQPQAARDSEPVADTSSAASGDVQETVSADLLTAVPDPASVVMPDLAFTPSPAIEATYDKYFYFHRADTGFEEALVDLRECDGFARGLVSSVTYTRAPYPYTNTVGGLVGGAIGNALAYAIYGSAEKRKLRRANMRRCMHYKGYQRFGLEKEAWQKFNFEEGLVSVKEGDRQRMLAQQAKVASAPGIQQRDLGL